LKRLFITALVPLLASGCAMDRDDFISDYATAYCDWLEDCAKIKTIHGTYSACVTKREIDASSTFAPGGDDCSFDADKAEECVSAFEDLECVQAEANVEACREVSDCYESTPEEEQTAQ